MNQFPAGRTSLLVVVWMLIGCAHSSLPNKAILPTARYFFLVGQGQVEAVQAALQAGQNPNQTNEQKVTPLMLASFKGHLSMVELLIRSGAQVNLLDYQGRSALFYSIDGQRNRIVTLLLRSKAQVNLKDSFNLTPLMVAASQGSSWLTEQLLNSGAKVDAVDEQGWDALFYAVAVQSEPVILKILNSGGQINRSDLDGNTLAHLCVERNNLEQLKLLVRHGINLQMKNRTGLSARDVAFQNLNFKISDYFESLDKPEPSQVTE